MNSNLKLIVVVVLRSASFVLQRSMIVRVKHSLLSLVFSHYRLDELWKAVLGSDVLAYLLCEGSCWHAFLDLVQRFLSFEDIIVIVFALLIEEDILITNNEVLRAEPLPL